MRPDELSDRQDRILAALNQRGRVLVDELAGRFDVSTQTIRKDLNELCDRGLASRIHGGARAAVLAPPQVQRRGRRWLHGLPGQRYGQLDALLTGRSQQSLAFVLLHVVNPEYPDGQPAA